MKRELDERGLHLKNASRVYEYVRTLNESLRPGWILTEWTAISKFARLYSEALYVADVYDGLRAFTDSTHWISKLAQALTGRALLVPADQSRDTLLELMLAGGARLGGYDARLAEPDVRLRLADGEYGIAAKRVRKSSTIVDNIRAAEDQLQRARTPGFIVLDITAAIESTGTPPVVQNSDDAHATLEQLHVAMLAELSDTRLKRSVRNPRHAFAVVGFAYRPIIIAGEHRVAVQRAWEHRTFAAAPEAFIGFSREFANTIALVAA